MAAARAEGRSLVRAVLAACPGLGPLLAREMDGSAASLAALRERLRDAAPLLLVPRPGPRARGTTPTSPTRRRSRSPRSPPRGRRADRAAALVLARGGGALPRGAPPRPRVRAPPARRPRRGAPADPASRAAGGEPRAGPRGPRRRGRPAAPGRGPSRLRPRGRGRARSRSSCRTRAIPGGVLVVALDPRLGGPRQRGAPVRQGAARRAGAPPGRPAAARDALGARSRRARARRSCCDARDPRELPGRADDAGAGDRGDAGAGPRHYLTGRGLSVLVGRNARENHHLTFRVARAEDLWLHARDAPGAHVVLRDNEGRAGADDLREAAEVAAFFSEARGESLVDVHVTRRKHVKPAPGGPGRVFVAHSDTLRVAPRDPEGRLRPAAEAQARDRAGRTAGIDRRLMRQVGGRRVARGRDRLRQRLLAVRAGDGGLGRRRAAVLADGRAGRGRGSSAAVGRPLRRRLARGGPRGAPRRPEGPGHRRRGRGGGPVDDARPPAVHARSPRPSASCSSA